ncbi:MAG: sialidase family protein, partial [Thermoanaerobaculia bacterium]
MARELGVTEIMGKPLPSPETTKPPVPGRLGREGDSIGSRTGDASGAITDQPGSSPSNTAIRDFPNVSEDEPTVAANPKHPNRLVAGSHFIGDTVNRCVAHFSSDSGKTWNSRPIFMPQLTHQSECSDPVLAYAPDGSRVYYAYLDIKFSHFDIVMSYSDDDGKSWKGPIVVLANVAADYDKPWIGTHVTINGNQDNSNGSGSGGQNNSNWVYATATRFDFASPGPCSIDFTRSGNKGQVWSAPQTLDTSGGPCGGGPSPVVQGSRPNGGKGGDVLVAWYNSGSDGFLAGTFEIRTRYSANNGATFGPIVIASTDTAELSFYLGPDFAYHRWWGGMFPDVEIAPNGTGHIAYITDPAPGPATAEEGDVRYSTSTGPPYAVWSLP